MSAAEYAARGRAALEAARAAGLRVTPATSQRLAALETKGDFGEKNKQAVRALERRVRGGPSAAPAAAAKKRPTQQQVTRHLASQAAAQIALGAKAQLTRALREAKAGPKGLGGARAIPDRYAKNANGYVTDPVSLMRIPRARAVKVGRQTYNSDTLRQLFARNARAPNPLTREPFPDEVYAKYGPPPAAPAAPLDAVAQKLWDAADAAASTLVMYRADRLHDTEEIQDIRETTDPAVSVQYRASQRLLQLRLQGYMAYVSWSGERGGDGNVQATLMEGRRLLKAKHYGPRAEWREPPAGGELLSRLFGWAG